MTAACLAGLAGGCDDSQPTQPQRAIVVRSEAQDRLHRLSEMNRKIALRRAIYDSGGRCRTVTQAGYVQEYGNLSMWTASCADGRSYAIFVAPDSSVQLRDCKQMEVLKLPACTIRGEGKTGG
ncbi:MAG TPA: hypothetical protein VFK58_03015 [Sphingomicrobium sp.]|nr:hypothetical protein [Sphingomicrobium sp.]